MESIIQKKNFLKNDNCIFSFFKFWNMDLNFIFRFFEIRILISIWIYGIWLWRQRDIVWLLDVCFVLCLILFNDFYFERWLFDKQNGFLENVLLKCFKGVNMSIGSSHILLLPQKLWGSCQQEFLKHETNVQGNRNFHILVMYSNYGINISVIIGSMMAASTKTLQFISITVLKIIFEQHAEKAGLWTYGLDA